jgi:hypothetical protein
MHPKPIIVLDLDETIGHFYDIYTVYICMVKSVSCFNDSILSQNQFNILLDSYNICLRPGIKIILNYLKYVKGSKKIFGVYLYTNNQCGDKLWIPYIIGYLHYIIKYKLFDQVIGPYKINGKIIEKCRCGINKSYYEIIKCLQLPNTTKCFFVDNTFYPLMKHDNVTYIKILSYKKIIDFNIDTCLQKMFSHSYYDNFKNKLVIIKHVKYQYNNILVNKTSITSNKLVTISTDYDKMNEYIIHKTISKQIIIYLDSYLNTE